MSDLNLDSKIKNTTKETIQRVTLFEMLYVNIKKDALGTIIEYTSLYGQEHCEGCIEF